MMKQLEFMLGEKKPLEKSLVFTVSEVIYSGMIGGTFILSIKPENGTHSHMYSLFLPLNTEAVIGDKKIKVIEVSRDGGKITLEIYE